MRFTYNQYNYSESGYRIPSKMHNSNPGNGSMAAAFQHHHRSNFGKPQRCTLYFKIKICISVNSLLKSLISEIIFEIVDF